MQILKHEAGASLTQDAVSLADSGALVAASTGKVIRVYRLALVAAAPTTLTIKDGTTSLTGAMSLAAGGAIVLDMDDDYPWFATTAGSALNVTLGTAVQLSGSVWYTKE